MRAFAVILALLCVCGASHADSTVQGACEGIEDDCEVAYTSLLQESLTLLKDVSGHDLAGKQPPSDASLESVSAVLSSSSNVGPYIVGIVACVGLGAAVYFFLLKPAQDTAERRRSSVPGSSMRHTATLEALMINYDNEDTVDVRDDDSLEEDTYSLAIALIIRDLQAIALGKCNKPLRLSRLLFSVSLIAMTVFLQVSILVCTKKYVTPGFVANIREGYSSYEHQMYGEHSYLNKNGKYRGIAGFFNASAFGDLDDDLKAEVCNIPLSQLGFFGIVLLVWAVTCMAQMKKCIEMFMAVICFATTIDDMADALTEQEDPERSNCSDAEDCDDSDRPNAGDCDDGVPVYVISGVTLPIKIVLVLCVFIPDLGTNAYVLWLGSRWLCATNDFADVISNAVALEFILMLKVLMYHALVSDRNKRDLQHTALAPCWRKEPAGYGIYFNTSVWALLAILWVYYYCHYQQVLPEYKWDVKEVCSGWLAHQLDPDADN